MPFINCSALRVVAVFMGAAGLSLGLFCSGAPAAEVINDFSSVVTIHADGGLSVREEITATAQGEDIKRGLYRDFPLKYSGPAAYTGQVPFKLISATLDGRELDVKDTEQRGDTLRILMRQPEPLTRGEHRFTLEYETSLHLRFYEEYGELNWNVTGVWGFEIQSFSCRIILPENVEPLQTAAWAGEAGTRSSEGISIVHEAPNILLFSSSRDADQPTPPLAPGEQFTVAASFPLGLIADPAAPLAEKQREERAEREARWEEEIALEAEKRRLAEERGFFSLLLYDHPRLPWQTAVWIFALTFFSFSWWKVGRDPKKGPIIARFHPPVAEYMGRGKSAADSAPAIVSPMAAEYLRGVLHSTSRGLTALLLSLAVKGLCVIRKTDDQFYAIQLTDRSGSDEPELAPEEQSVYEVLKKAAANGELVLRPQLEAVRNIFKAAQQSLKLNYQNAWRRNLVILAVGWFIVLPVSFTFSAWDGIDLDEGLELLFMNLLFIFILLLPVIVYRLSGKSWLKTGAIAAFLWFFAVLMWRNGYFEWLNNGFSILLLSAAALFSFLMKAPSRECRAALDKIEGLALYMRMAENDRLEMFNRSDEAMADSSGMFQRLLPYAFVFGLEKTWCNRFSDKIAQGIMEESGVDIDLAKDLNALEAFTAGFSTAVSNAAAADTSSSSSSSSGSAFGSGGGGAGSGSGGGGGGGL